MKEMAKDKSENVDELGNPDEGAPDTQPAAPDTSNLQTALDEANASLVQAQADLVASGSTNDLKAMLAAADAIKLAARNVDKAKTAIDSAEFETKAAERMAFSVGLKETVEAFVAASVDVARMQELGLLGIHVTVDETGTPLVSVTSKTREKAAKVASTREPGQPSSRGNWSFQGSSYTSRQLLESFGGEAGAKAIDRASNYKDYGMKFSPGFDAAVKKLASEIGATRE